MYHRRYDKVFLMLRQETAGYAIGKRPPWGSCIMELKNGTGRLLLTVQGLRPLAYAVYLLAGEESILCGEIRPEPKEGRCELKWAFDPDAVGAGKRAEDFHTVLILAEEGGGYSAPLVAYFGERKDWRAMLRPQKMPKAEPPKRAEKPRAELPEPPKEEPKIVLQAAENEALPEEGAEQAAAQSYHGSFQGLLARFRKELENLEETGVLTAAETDAIRAAGGAEKTDGQGVESDGQSADFCGKSTSADGQGVDTTTERTDKSGQQADPFGQNKELEPFGDGVRWKCLFLEELTLLSEIPLKWQKEFFFLLPYRRYHHLILRQEENGYWLGLPGEYSEAEEREAQQFGFREFRPVDGDWGYWLAFLAQEG